MITIENLSFGYSKNQELFKNLNLEIGPGKICGLLGKNGAGKTTLLRHLIGNLFPNEGTITVHGDDVTKRNPQTIREIFYLQEDSQLPNMSINLYQKIYAPFYERFDTTKFYDLLGKSEVDATAKISALSFGQKRKVQIAFALSTGVKLLLMIQGLICPRISDEFQVNNEGSFNHCSYNIYIQFVECNFWEQ